MSKVEAGLGLEGKEGGGFRRERRRLGQRATAEFRASRLVCFWIKQREKLRGNWSRFQPAGLAKGIYAKTALRTLMVLPADRTIKVLTLQSTRIATLHFRAKIGCRWFVKAVWRALRWFGLPASGSIDLG